MQSELRQSRLLLLFLSSHPGPSIAVAGMCAVLGMTMLDGWRVATVGFAVLFGQFSVGLSNDWLDAARDRTAGRTDKPAATGEITVAMVRNAAVITGAAGLALTLLVGLPATCAHAVFITAGWAYNLGLKKTVMSVIPYVIGFGALPALVTLARDVPAAPAWWAMTASAALGIAAHFANVLPDIADDRATGVVGLPHLLGLRLSTLATFVALASATVVIVFGSGVALTTVDWITMVVEATIVFVGVFLALTRPPGRPLFRLVILGALVAALSLMLSGENLVS